MILVELINPIIKNVQLGHRFSDNINYTDFANEIGHGESHIAVPTDDPHIVNKKSLTYWIDGGDAYALELVKTKKFNENPYFPRIYNLTTVVDNRGQVKVNIDMERLQKFQIFDTETIIQYMKNIIDISKLKHCLNSELASNKNVILHKFSLNVNSYIENGGPLDFIKDPMLINALQFIRNLSVKYHLIDDFHPENIMVRIGGAGIQMVLADPLAGERKMNFS